MDEPDNKDSKSSFKDLFSKPLIKADSKAYRYSGLGVQLAFTILVFLFIGIWLDGVFETRFIFTLVLTLLGFAGGFYSFFLTIQKLGKKTDDKFKK